MSKAHYPIQKSTKSNSDHKCPTCDQSVPRTLMERVGDMVPDLNFKGFMKEPEGNQLLIFYSNGFTGSFFKGFLKKLRKLYPKWDGNILNLRPGEKIESLDMGMTQSLYEALMSKFDPDLFQIRMARKAKAEAEAIQAEKAENLDTANQVADHLEEIGKQREQAKIDRIAEATRNLSAAK